MDLAQAVRSGQRKSAYRVVGTQRIVVELSAKGLRVLVQCWSKRRWVLPDQGSSIHYLNGVLREADGSWVVACNDLAALDRVAYCLPTGYRHLLVPNSDDWQPLENKKSG